MTLDRQSIERRDFPIARRGYEIDAVDAHLARLADEYDALAGRGTGGLAAAASDQVRAIVEAAEHSAAGIRAEAELEARRLGQDAREDAERMRADAGRQAREHVESVAEVARGLLERVESMDRELGSLLEGLRGGAQRVAADLSLLQGSVGELRAVSERAPDSGTGDAAAGGPAGGEAAASAPIAADAGRRSAASSGEPPGDADAARPANDAADAQAGGEPAEDPSQDALARAASEEEGARMVALNMALNGVSRADAERHLQANFDVTDVSSLLDDAYAGSEP